MTWYTEPAAPCPRPIVAARDRVGQAVDEADDGLGDGAARGEVAGLVGGVEAVGDGAVGALDEAAAEAVTVADDVDEGDAVEVHPVAAPANAAMASRQAAR
jgi:hypothetical protein